MMAFLRLIDTPLKGLRSFRWVLYLWLICAVYIVFIASDRYVSTSQVYVKSSTVSATQMIPDLSMIATGISQASPDLLLLQEYIRSRDMFMKLDSLMQIRDHYASDEWDFVSRLKPWASDEDALAFYQSHVDIIVDSETRMMVLRAQGFSPEYALALTEVLLREGEHFINQVGQDIALQEISFVEQEVLRAKVRLDAAKAKLLAFMSDNETLSPAAEGEAFQSTISSLRAQLIELETQEKELSSFLNDGASELVSVQARIDAVNAQLQAETNRMSENGENSLGQLNAAYQELELSVGFATNIYRVSITALEQTRVQAYQKLKHLVVVQAPALPDEAAYPRKLYDLVTLLVVFSLLYGISAMITATIKENRNA